VAGKIIAIYIAPSEGAPQLSMAEARLTAGAGILGDRNYHPDAEDKGHNLTLVEAEEIERFAGDHEVQLPLETTRRNLVTRGVRLNELVGREFSIGEVRARGIRLCEPCVTLAGLLASSGLEPSAVIAGFLHRAGLRAEIVLGGAVKVGDPVDPL
jgi:MOSC domain-containing protein YiiM